MLLKLFRFLRGYVDFCAKGKFPERFMNITARYGINIWNATPIKNGIYASMHISDYRKIRLVARKAKVRASIQKRHGLPFILNRYKQRKGLVAGAAVSIVIMLILSNFIWSINIVGIERLSDTYVREILAENGIIAGAYKNNLDVESIERRMALKISDIGWMSINITGNTVNVEIKEKALKPHIESNTNPCNIKAACDGVITNIKATSGTVQVLKGSGVTKGDLLVSGINQTKLDSIEYIHANAEVYADVNFKRELKIPESINYYSITENKTDRKRFSFLWFELPCSFSFDTFKDSVSFAKAENLYVNNVILPVGIKTMTTCEIRQEKINLSKSQVKKIIKNDSLLYEAFEKQSSKVVSKSYDLIKENGGYSCTTEYVFNENIAESVEFKVT